AHRLDLLDADEPQRCAGEPHGPETFAPVVARRLAALDAEIARLTRLRERLAPHAAAGPAPDNEG
ncbi:MerR family transcriptional regulator, partial [Kitasatospora sp. NPDC093558]